MTPNFALGLTELGITLWQRDTAGWLRVGAVPMDAPDIDDQMLALVGKARALAPDGIVTKLVIPDDQILYTHLPVAQEDVAIRAALHGKTPYPVEELDFDWIPQGDGVLAAVVARETLVEAEDFARAQGLNPVCFVAAPEARGFPQEPFFKVARGVRLDPADLGRGGPILRETGFVPDALPSDPEPVAEPAPEPVAEPTPAAVPEVTSKAEPDPAQANAKPEPAPSAPPPAPGKATPGASPATEIKAEAPKVAPAAQPKAAPPPPLSEAVGFRSRRAPGNGAAQPTTRAPKPASVPKSVPYAPMAKPAAKALALKVKPPSMDAAREMATKLLPGTGIVTRLRAARTALQKKAKSRALPAPRPAPTAKPDPQAQTKPAQPPIRTPSVAKALRAAPLSGKPDSDPEAERLTVFGARRTNAAVQPGLPRRALLISGAALMLVLAVAIWAFYFTRTAPEDLAQPVLPLDTTSEVAAPDPLALPDLPAEETAEIEAALGATDAAQAQGSAPETGAEPAEAEGTIAPEVAQPDLATAQPDAGRLAALRSVRAIAPDSPGNLPAVQAPPAPFGATPLPPLREDLAQPVTPADNAAPEVAEPAPLAPVQPSLPAGEEALEIEVTEGRPAVVPPARPAGIAPEPEAAITPEVIPEAIAEAQSAPETTLDPLDESNLVIDVTEGAPAITPPTRPEGIAPEPVLDAPAEAAPDTSDTPESATDPDQASLTPPPGGVALTLIAPAPRPAEIAEQAAVQAEQFASATPQAVAASLRPSNRPSGFSQNVQRALAAARIRQVAPPAPEAQIVQASAASVAPRIPSSASVSSAATQTRAINLRQINLLGVMGTPSARRALVRLDNGRVVTVQVGERLDGGQVTAIGDSELRYNKRGRDVVLRIAS
ncbi:MAG: hypothetical protein JXQ79_08575 [Rhodobacteraceae bacterium]|nr:hypothetical protein [Paracoccaceae bacterium]